MGNTLKIQTLYYRVRAPGWWPRWLVINKVHICYIRKDRGTKKTSTWECSGRRRLGCEFKMRTTKPEGPGALTIIQMSDPEIHLCSADKVAPLIDAKVSYAGGKKDEGRFGC